MTTRTDILRRIEGLLGSEGSEDEAEAVFEVLDQLGYIEFDGWSGYDLAIPDVNDDGATWNTILRDAQERARGSKTSAV